MIYPFVYTQRPQFPLFVLFLGRAAALLVRTARLTTLDRMRRGCLPAAGWWV